MDNDHWVRAEFHCHTVYSKDSLTAVEALIAECRRKGIDRLAVTDHNNIAGALEAQRLAPELVIVGEEIMTTQGELLAFFVAEQVPRGLEPEEAIRILRDQGAFISVSHPFDRQRGGAWDLPDLLAIAPLVDAVESFNARCLEERANREAAAFAQAHNLPGTRGSDAHLLFEVGRATQRLPNFHDAASLREALRQSQPEGGLSPFWVHFGSTYAKWRKKVLGKPKSMKV